MELNEAGIDSQLAIETSGHAAYKENFFLDDGAYLATKIVIKAAQMKARGALLEEILTSLEEPQEAAEYRFPIETPDFKAYGDEILEGLKNWAAAAKAVNREGQPVTIEMVRPNYEGVRLNFRGGEALSGWCLLRKSLHDPIMPLNIEVTSGCCDEILNILKGYLTSYDKLKLPTV